MKRVIILFFITVIFCSISCKKGENPLDVNTDLPAGAGAQNLPKVEATYPNNRSLLMDEDNTTPGIQAAIIVTFSDYMDEESFTRDAVLITNTTTLSTFTPETILYLATHRRLYIKSNSWTGSSAFLLTLKSSKIKNTFGAPLDGDGNGKEDGAPYDDKLLTFYTSGSSPDSCVDIFPPQISSIFPDTGRITNRMPMVLVTFNKRMDTLTFSEANVKLQDEMGRSIPINIIRRLNEVSFQPRESLLWDRLYIVKLVSDGIKAESSKGKPGYLRRLDGDGDGCEATEPDFSFYFLLDSIAPPVVWDLTRGADNFRITFSTLMDESSLTETTVRGYDDKGYNGGRIALLTENNRTTLYYYFLRPVAGRIKVFISRDVRSNKGRKLDGNGNGIGGEIFDDYWNR